MITVDKDNISQHTIGLRLLRKTGATPIVYDIEQNVTLLSISQALSMKSMFLKMMFQDASGIYEKGLLTLGDIIELTLYRSDDDETKIFKEFRIIDISGGKQTDNTKMTQFAIHAITEPAFINKGSRISKSVTDKVSNIALEIIEQKLKIKPKNINIEPTKNSTSIIFNKTTPFEALSELEDRAISASGSAKDNLYFCFETPEGITFSSVRQLVNKRHKFIYNQFPSSLPTEDENDYFRIQHFEQPNFGNRADLVENGVLENEVVLFDILNRRVLSYDFVFEEDKKDILLLGKHASADYNTLSNELSGYSKQRSSFDNKVNVSYFPAEESFERIEWRDKKHSSSRAQLELLRQNKITIKILGNHELLAGDVLKLIVPAKYFTDGEADEEDKRYTGEYLVAAVRHDIAIGENFFTIVDLYKDALELKVENL